jgi:hypothetical protein
MVAMVHAAPTAPAPIIPIFMRVLACRKGEIVLRQDVVDHRSGRRKRNSLSYLTDISANRCRSQGLQLNSNLGF